MAPGFVLLGYCAMRLVIVHTTETVVNVCSCMVWLFISIGLLRMDWHKVALLWACSGITYPMFGILGYQIEYFGLSVMISEAFAVLALLGMGGGIVGMASHNHPAFGGNGAGNADLLSYSARGLAEGRCLNTEIDQ